MSSLDFISVPLRSKNLDRYIVRRSIIKSIRESLPYLKGDLLDAGCGKMPYRTFILKNSEVSQYVGLDIEGAMVYDINVKPDFTWDGKVMPFSDSSFHSAIATEVLEHCPEPDVFLKEIHRVLRSGGILFFTVPFLWNLHEVPHDEYRYTPFSLERHLRNGGFKDIKIQALGGWHASLGQMIGLWVRRGPMPRIVRGLLSIVLMPVVFCLYKIDRRESVKFKAGSMVTGLYGIAVKN